MTNTLHGHANVVANICFDCGGDLRADDGSHSEYHYDAGGQSFAAAICNFCKLIRQTEQEAPKVPLSFRERLKELKLKPGVNWAVACWIKTVIDADSKQIIDRQYVVNMDSSIVTRRDEFDLSRSLKSLETDGWQVYTPRTKVKGVEQTLDLVEAALTPQGYSRRF